MRVLVFGDASSPNVDALCRGLRDVGAAVDLWSFERPLDPTAAMQPWGPLRKLGKARYHVAGVLARRAVRHHAPDVVVGYFVTGYGTIARLCGRRPFALVAAGSDVLVTPRGSLAARSATRNLRAAELVVAGGEHVVVGCRRLGMPPGTTVLVRPRGIDLAAFPTASAPPGPPRLVTTRSLAPIYRHDRLIDALASARLATLDARLTMVGDGPLRGDLAARIVAKGLGDRVALVGRIPSDQVGGLLAGHHVYASACPTDGSSASLLEAMRVGLLPVVADNPANRAWVEDGRNGILFDPTSDVALLEALARAAEDRSLQERARQLNPAIVEARGDLDVGAKAIVAALRRAVEGAEVRAAS